MTKRQPVTNKYFVSSRNEEPWSQVNTFPGRWMAEYVRPWHMLAGGARVNPSDFITEDNKDGIIHSGRLLFRPYDTNQLSLKYKEVGGDGTIDVNLNGRGAMNDTSSLWKPLFSFKDWVIEEGGKAYRFDSSDTVKDQIGKMFRRVVDSEFGFVYDTNTYPENNPQVDLIVGYTGFRVYENLLPDWKFLFENKENDEYKIPSGEDNNGKNGIAILIAEIRKRFPTSVYPTADRLAPVWSDEGGQP
ncbi:MAG: hypothetical protein F6K53_20455 [Moorea sp. SIO4A1]|uniref:hypothetical protein n=1 Tax=Moorena sp. SIO4A1 TaxID=2607835 RepID=UPI0014179461|nr:hypothetical protein [Moorena sp. SIO4A1]NEO43715.1 hypothetical protein [Moorena sp. SIO4A3]NEQ59645.1 hypothetical protein [Moorena sp. SIO4A1]